MSEWWFCRDVAYRKYTLTETSCNKKKQRTHTKRV